MGNGHVRVDPIIGCHYGSTFVLSEDGNTLQQIHRFVPNRVYTREKAHWLEAHNHLCLLVSLSAPVKPVRASQYIGLCQARA